MTTHWFSLQRRLLALLLGGVTIGWLATMSFSYFDAHHEIDELFDAGNGGNGVLHQLKSQMHRQSGVL